MTLPHFVYCLKKIDTTSVSIQQILSFSSVDLFIWAGYRRAAMLCHLRTHRFPGGPVQGQFLVLSAHCKVSKQERAVKPGSCHHTQHLKVLWKTNSHFECLNIFLVASFLLFFPVTFHWLWCLASVRFSLGN